jgi:hypothetical protein
MAASRAAVGQTVATEKVPGPSNLPQIKPVLGVEIELLLEHTAPRETDAGTGGWQLTTKSGGRRGGGAETLAVG